MKTATSILVLAASLLSASVSTALPTTSDGASDSLRNFQTYSGDLYNIPASPIVLVQQNPDMYAVRTPTTAADFSNALQFEDLGRCRVFSCTDQFNRCSNAEVAGPIPGSQTCAQQREECQQEIANDAADGV